MNTWKEVAIILGSIIILVLLGIVGLIVYATSDMCGNEVYSQTLSPNNEHKAVVFQRDCGATTGFSTQISIIDADDDLNNESGNIYIIDGHPKDVSPQVSWISDSELNIGTGLSGSEYKAESSIGFINKISVTYGAKRS